MTFNHKDMPELDKLWVVSCVSNPARFSNRYECFKKFKESMDRAGVNLLVVELAFGDRPFEIEAENIVRLRTTDELWHKENLLNIGASRIPDFDWKYVVFADADIQFVRNDWAIEIVHKLQHYQVIQPFINAIDLGPQGEVYRVYDSFVYSYTSGAPKPYSLGSGPHWHPGYTWAFRREALDELGGLIDWAPLGSADHHMAHALIGSAVENTPKKIMESYKEKLKIWQDRALRHINKNIGFIEDTIIHHWHGKKKNRKYIERWSVLIDNQFCPERDIKKNSQGLYIFSASGEKLRIPIHKYFMERNEDDNTL